MDKSPTIGAMAAALAKAQASMTFARRDSTANYGSYADLASIVEAVKGPLTTNGIAYTQTTDIDPEGGIIVETMLLHSSGEWISSPLRMKPTQGTPQGIGSAITYARRYGLQAICGIPTDDDDGDAASRNTTQQAKPKPAPKPEPQPAPQPEATPAETPIQGWAAHFVRHAMAGQQPAVSPEERAEITQEALEVVASLDLTAAQQKAAWGSLFKATGIKGTKEHKLLDQIPIGLIRAVRDADDAQMEQLAKLGQEG